MKKRKALKYISSLDEFGKKSAAIAKRLTKQKKNAKVPQGIVENKTKQLEFQLRVAEAAEDDAGVARIDIDVIKSAGITELVEIEGSKKTSALARQACIEDRGLRRIRIDKAIRRACGASIGDTVIVRKTDSMDYLAAINQKRATTAETMESYKSETLFESYIKKQFIDLEKEIDLTNSLDSLIAIGEKLGKMRLAISDEALTLYVKEKARLIKMIEKKTGGAIKMQRE
jgi:hypothetical protein